MTLHRLMAQTLAVLGTPGRQPMAAPTLVPIVQTCTTKPTQGWTLIEITETIQVRPTVRIQAVVHTLDRQRLAALMPVLTARI